MRRGWPRAPTQTICNRSDTVVPKSPQRLFEVRARPFPCFLEGESQGSALIRVSSNLAPFRTARTSAFCMTFKTLETLQVPRVGSSAKAAHVPVLLCCGGF